MSNRAVFLDRDGVINRAIVKNGKPYPPASLEALEIPVVTLAVLQAFKKAGYLLIGVTNQPDVVRGSTSKETVESINKVLLKQLPVDDIFVCYHDNLENCQCRKPQPGLLLDAAKKYNICLEESFMIGDRWRDIEAAHRARCQSVWINYGYNEQSPSIAPNYTACSLTDAARWILNGISRNAPYTQLSL